MSRLVELEQLVKQQLELVQHPSQLVVKLEQLVRKRLGLKLLELEQPRQLKLVLELRQLELRLLE